jgi:biofilm protein TabA
MALFGPLAAVRERYGLNPAFRAAFAYANEALTPGSPVHARIVALEAGATHRQELAGGAYAVEMAYLTKPRADGFFETHRRYVDVQVVVEGDEFMEVAAAGALGLAQPYDAAKDFTKHTDAAAPSVLRIPAGHAAVFWPEDAHMPSLAVGRPALVRKTVVKVPVAG